MILALLLEPFKKYLIIGGAAIAALYAAYLCGEHTANEKHAAAQVQQQIKDLNFGIAVDAMDRTKMVEQQNKIETLNKELASARAKIKNPDSVCFESDDVDQLLNIWPEPTTPTR